MVLGQVRLKQYKCIGSVSLLGIKETLSVVTGMGWQRNGWSKEFKIEGKQPTIFVMKTPRYDCCSVSPM